MPQTKPCQACGVEMRRRVRPSGNREAYTKWAARQHCSYECRYGKPIQAKGAHPCAHCGTTTKRPKYCSKQCYGLANTKPDHPAEVRDHRGRQKARRTIPLTECAKCKTTNDLQRHHIDLNPRNNAPANIAILCRTCHCALHVALRKASTLRLGIFTYAE